ncbi:MAG: DMT family transporter [Alphaproteobacteria bacterium]|nr:DMT family transporter [Alphaproteobacteria bacterium]
MAPSSPSAASSNALLAITCMVAAGFLNTVMLSAIKQLTSDLHPFEIAFFRSLVGFLVLLPLIWRSGGFEFMRTSQIGRHVLRGALNAGGMLLYFWAVALAPLATVSAIGFASPLFAALLAILILREKVGLRRWAGLAIGFAGTIVILRPGSGIIEFGALIALGSSVMWAGAMITIKQLTGTESPLAITTWGAFSVGVFCLIPALFFWQWPTLEQCLWLVVVGILGSIIQLSLAKAFSLADTTLVLPFDFLKLVWASIFGYLLFAEVPSLWAWVGGMIISASAFYIAYRERVRSQPT